MFDFNLYLITDRGQISKEHAECSGQGFSPHRSLLTVIEEALKAGIKAIQLREKDLSARELFELAQSVHALTRQYGAKLFINDRVDIALSVGAEGVHLGQKSFSANEAKGIFKGMIGASTHSVEEARRAEEEGADFITLGPVFHTPSKADYGKPLGAEMIRKVKRSIKIPVFAIGGIKKENIQEVKEAGVDGVAVISAIMYAKKPGKAVKELIQEFGEEST